MAPLSTSVVASGLWVSVLIFHLNLPVSLQGSFPVQKTGVHFSRQFNTLLYKGMSGFTIKFIEQGAFSNSTSAGPIVCDLE